MKTAFQYLKDAGYEALDEAMGGTIEELIRAAQIDALGWAVDEITNNHEHIDAVDTIDDKIEELEQLP